MRTRSVAVSVIVAVAGLMPSPALVRPTCFGKAATIVGKRGDDVLRGTARTS